MGIFRNFKGYTDKEFIRKNILNKALSDVELSYEEKDTYKKLANMTIEDKLKLEAKKEQAKIDKAKEEESRKQNLAPDIVKRKQLILDKIKKGENLSASDEEFYKKYFKSNLTVKGTGATTQAATKATTSKPKPSPTTSSNLDDIKKLKALLDDKAITKEEYEIKKKEILGL